jgi:hypothetical protein
LELRFVQQGRLSSCIKTKDRNSHFGLSCKQLRKILGKESAHLFLFLLVLFAFFSLEFFLSFFLLREFGLVAKPKQKFPEKC